MFALSALELFENYRKMVPHWARRSHCLNINVTLQKNSNLAGVYYPRSEAEWDLTVRGI